MRKQVWNSTGLVSDNIGSFSPTDLRQSKYDEIRSEMDSRIAVVSESMQAEQDAADVGAEPNSAKVTALKQERHDIRQKAKTVKTQVDALGNNNTAIYEFDVKAAF